MRRHPLAVWTLLVATATVTVGPGRARAQAQQQPPNTTTISGREFEQPVRGNAPVQRGPLQVPQFGRGGVSTVASPGGMPDSPYRLGPGVAVANDPGVWQEKTWLCWWETNRDAVLKRALAKLTAGQPAAASVAPGQKSPERDRAVAVLTKALTAERAPLRAAAAISLGQMRETSVAKQLITLQRKETDEKVRGYVWLSLGLMGGPDAEKALVIAKPKSEFEQLGIIAAIGMLDRPTEPMFQLLRVQATTAQSPEVRRMALWAMRVHHRAADHDIVLTALTQQGAPGATPNLQIASEAALGLGAIGDVRDADLLADVATDGHAADIPSQQVVAGGGGYDARNRTTIDHPIVGGNGSTVGTGVSHVTVGTPRAPSSSLPSRWSFVRVSASIALGEGPGNGKALAASSVLARNALLRNFANYLDQGGPASGGASILSFAKSTSDRDAYVLHDIVDMGTDPMIGMVNPRSPMRAYAALGLGLYMQNGGPSKIATRPIGGVAPPGYDMSRPDYIDVNEMLGIRMANRQESSDFKAACALALGLSGDPASARRLTQAYPNSSRDELVTGYTALALALLNDKTALNLAGPMLSGGGYGPTKIDPETVSTRGIPSPGAPPTLSRAANNTNNGWEDVKVPQDGPALMSLLGRRAALLAVAILNDPQRTETLLAASWARDRALTQDVARAIGWTHTVSLTAPLSDLVERDKKGAVEAAMSLGWAFDPDRPSRLSKFVLNNNYHQPQTEYVDRPGGQPMMIRDFARLDDLFLYSTPLGGPYVAPPRPAATQPAGLNSRNP